MKNILKFDDTFIEFLVNIINLYNPKRKGLFSKPMMEYQAEDKFIAGYRPSQDSPEHQVGTEPESLSNAIASLQILTDELGIDSGEIVITLYDKRGRVIIVFGQIEGDQHFQVVVGQKYSSKKANSSFRFLVK